MLGLPHARPRVPLHVEDLTTLRDRYALAIAELVIQADVVSGRRLAPSGDPIHVFDTPDGWRLIVSRDRLPDGRVGIHLSASAHSPAGIGAPLVDTLDAIVRAWRFLANTNASPLFLGISRGGVPHWFLEQES